MTKHIKKLYRSRKDKILAGVAGGLGEYFEMDSIIFRILFILFLFIGGASLLIYIILILVIPTKTESVSKKKKSKGAEKKDKDSWKFSGRHFVGLIVVLIGLIILLVKMFPVTWGWFRWDVFWAMIIVLIGFFILLKD